MTGARKPIRFLDPASTRGVRAFAGAASVVRRAAMLAAVLGLVLGVLAPPPRAAGQASEGKGESAVPHSIPASRQAKNVAIITIEGAIDGDTAVSVKRRMDDAVRGGANAIVFDINSPGGEVGAVLEICTAIKRCPVSNTVAWVHPDAYSGGAIIALACREIVVSDAATMGDAAPIQIAFGLFLNTLPDTERAKVLAPLLQEIVDSARLRGYDEKLVQGLVSLGVELWMIESLERPGEVLFVDRDEYEVVFGQPPGPATPALVGPSSRPDGIAPPPPTKVDEIVKNIEKSTKKRGGQALPGGDSRNFSDKKASEGEGAPFIPASPTMTDSLARDVTSRLDRPTGRPTLTPDRDRGKWKMVQYVSDGRTLYTFKESQLFDYRIASRSHTTRGTVNDDEELKSFFGATYMARLNRSGLEAVAAFLNHIVVKGLLIAVFLIGLFIEMIHPGLILPGSLAAIALVLLLTPAILMGLGAWWQVGAILLGIMFLGVELFIIPGFGVFGILGLLSLFGGLVGTFTIGGALFPDSPGQGDVLYGVVTLMVAAVTAGGVIYAITRHMGRVPVFSKMVLDSAPPDEDAGVFAGMGAAADIPVAVGEVGIAATPLRPSGRAQFGDVMADVTSESGYIAPGQTVRVVEASTFRIVVEPAAGMAVPAAPSPTDQSHPPHPQHSPRGSGGGVMA